MKKLLALVLALVMTLGLATVSANAALDDFSDAADVSYEEAMSVMNAVGVFVGSDGKLAPKDNLTRAQAAKIITYLDLGETAAEALSKDVTAFSDVAAGNWATGYITYCYNAGIIAGDGAGKFNPNDQVTGLQFAKMLLVVLGYDAQREGLVGSDYALNTTKLAAKNDLFADNEGLSVNTPATREEAALYAFNALKANTVDYATASTTVKGGGLEVTVGGSAAAPVTSTAAYAAAITNEGATDILQLGEKLYKGNLQLNEANDDMGRPSNNWSWKTATVVKAPKTADYTIIVKKTGKTYDDLIDDVSKSLKTNAMQSATVNGTTDLLAAAAPNGFGAGTANIGDVIEVYMSDTVADSVEYVAVTRYAVGKLSGAAATRTSSGEKQIRLPGVNNLSSWIDTDKFFGPTDLAKDDIVLWYKDNNNNYFVSKAESFDGQLKGAKTNETVAKYNIDGTNYIVSENVAAVDGLGTTTTPAATYNTEYRYWKDANGFIVYGKKLEETNKNYVMIETLKWNAGGNSISDSGSAEARIVKLDGTVEVVKVAKIDGFEPVVATTNTQDLYTGTSTVAESYVTGATAAAANTLGATTAVAAAASTAAQYYTVYDIAGAGTAVPATPVLGRYIALDTAADNNVAATKTMLYTFKTNSDGEYEFTTAASSSVATGAVTSVAAATYKASTGKLNATVVNDDTVFVVVNKPTASSPKYTVYTGKANVPEFVDGAAGTTIGTDLMFAYASEKSVATVVFVYSYQTKATTGDWLFVLSGKVGETEVKDGGSTYSYNVYKALKSGSNEVVDLMVDSTASTTLNTNGVGLYGSLTFDAKTGALTSATREANQTAATGVYGYNVSGSTLSVQKTFGANAYTTGYNFPSDTIVVYKDADDNFTVGTASEFTSDANDTIWVALTNGTDNKTKVVYIAENGTDDINVTLEAGLVATKVAATGTVTSGGVTYNVGTKYTVTGADGAKTVTFGAGCARSTDGTTWTSVDAGGTTVTPAAASALYIMAEDMSVTMYQF